MLRKPELLAPAGTMESFYAALQGGCDAVYLGGYMFGARNFAGNFSLEEMKEAVYVAHLYGVKIYVTVNTLVYEREVEQFIHYIDELVSIHVDALIIEDIGMFDLIHQRYPELELHASTQMHIHNASGVAFAKKVGFKRAVIARETPIEEIKEVRKNIDLPLEVFCHGALCVSYSGQCLMSSFIGGRSGNRGTCAQCCRLPYTLCDENKKEIKDGYLLSTKDLKTIESIGEFIEAGVDSLKIEGRMKRPEYVYYVTSLYRKAIDSYLEHGKVIITDEEMKNIKKLFHREFTKGFLFGEDIHAFTNIYRPNHMGIEIGTVISSNQNRIQIRLTDDIAIHDGLRILDKTDIGVIVNQFYKNRTRVKQASRGDVIELEVKTEVTVGSKVVKTTDANQLKTYQEEIGKKKRRVLLKGTVTCQYGEPLKLFVTDGIHEITVFTDKLLEVPKKSPVSKEEMKEKLSRLTDTVYQFESLDIIGDEGFIPISALNALRRSMELEMNQKRTERPVLEKQEYQYELNLETVENSIHHSKLITDVNQIDEKTDVFYVEEKLYHELKENPKVFLKLPNVCKTYDKLEDGTLISEYGGLIHGENLVTNYNFNVANSYAVYFLRKQGVKRVTLSLECDEKDIEELYDAYFKRYEEVPAIEVVEKSLPVVMSLKYPILKNYQLRNVGYLKNKNQQYFKVVEKENQTDIYFYQEKEIQVPNLPGLTKRVEEIEW